MFLNDKPFGDRGSNCPGIVRGGVWDWADVILPSYFFYMLVVYIAAIMDRKLIFFSLSTAAIHHNKDELYKYFSRLPPQMLINNS
jgi:hypothetical protein